jgi:hypothetical protein
MSRVSKGPLNLIKSMEINKLNSVKIGRAQVKYLSV